MLGNIMPVEKANVTSEGILIRPANNFVIPSAKSYYSFSTVMLISDVRQNQNGHNFEIKMTNPNTNKEITVFKANIPDEKIAFGPGKTSSFVISMTNLNISGTGEYTFKSKVDGIPLNQFSVRFEVKSKDE